MNDRTNEIVGRTVEELEREIIEKDNAIAALRKVESGLRQALLTYEGQTHFICECGGTKLAEERLAKLEQVAEGLAKVVRCWAFDTSYEDGLSRCYECGANASHRLIMENKQCPVGEALESYQSYLKSKGETK